jgi:predicted DNA-binding ribbon-helix-helix protein
MTSSDVQPETKQKKPGESRFRILSIDGKRRAFKLEAAFWQALQEMAHAKGERLSLLISGLLSEAANENASSILRVAAASWLLETVKKQEERSIGARWQRIIDLIEQPAFIINQAKQIVLFNRPMQTLSAGDVSSPAVLKLGLGVEISRVLTLFQEQEQRIISLPCTLESGGRTVRAAIKMTLLERRRGNAFLLCALKSPA